MKHFPHHLLAKRTFYRDVTIELTGSRGCGSHFEVEVEFTATPDIPARTYGPPEDCYPAEGGEREVVSIKPYYYPITAEGLPTNKRVYLDVPKWLEETLAECVDVEDFDVDWEPEDI